MARFMSNFEVRHSAIGGKFQQNTHRIMFSIELVATRHRVSKINYTDRKDKKSTSWS